MTPSRKDKDPQSFSSRRDKEREKAEKERAAVAVAAVERLKAVVRRLPPNLPEDVFWQSVQLWVSDETITWKVFYPGKFKKKINKENVPSRAYIAFKNEELLAQFGKDYDGHVFRDKQGNESQAIVEFAPYQKMPSDKKKVDARNATIEKDEDYISFITSLNEPANTEPVSIEALIAANQAQVPPMPKTTPLLEALKAEKSASKDKEAILRNHAHYKDPVVFASNNAMRGAGSSAKDEVGKKKGGPSVHPKEVASEAGKKGKKPQPTQIAAARQQQAAAAMAKKEHAQSPKPSRAARQQAAAAKAAAATQPVTQPQAHASGVNKPVDVPPLAASSSGENGEIPPMAASTVPAQVAAAAASRRGRPILGLGSRQLQAALSQVGAAAIERKKREREKEASKEGTGADAAEGSSEMGKGLELLGPDISLPASPEPPADTERSKPGTPSSPRRGRGKKEKVGHQYEAGLKVPSIMQRPDGIPPPALQRDAAGQVLPSPARGRAASPNDNVVPVGPTGGPPPRGPRRGRGRGRGGPIHRGG